MPNFVTKPEKVEAVQFADETQAGALGLRRWTDLGSGVVVYTLNRDGTADVCVGDWIVTYEDGRREVFDDAAFRERFEEVQDG